MAVLFQSDHRSVVKLVICTVKNSGGAVPRPCPRRGGVSAWAIAELFDEYLFHVCKDSGKVTHRFGTFLRGSFVCAACSDRSLRSPRISRSALCAVPHFLEFGRAIASGLSRMHIVALDSRRPTDRLAPPTSSHPETLVI